MFRGFSSSWICILYQSIVFLCNFRDLGAVKLLLIKVFVPLFSCWMPPGFVVCAKLLKAAQMSKPWKYYLLGRKIRLHSAVQKSYMWRVQNPGAWHTRFRMWTPDVRAIGRCAADRWEESGHDVSLPSQGFSSKLSGGGGRNKVGIVWTPCDSHNLLCSAGLGVTRPRGGEGMHVGDQGRHTEFMCILFKEQLSLGPLFTESTVRQNALMAFLWACIVHLCSAGINKTLHKEMDETLCALLNIQLVGSWVETFLPITHLHCQPVTNWRLPLKCSRPHSLQLSLPSPTAASIKHMEEENSRCFSKAQTLMVQCKLSKYTTSSGKSTPLSFFFFFFSMGQQRYLWEVHSLFLSFPFEAAHRRPAKEEEEEEEKSPLSVCRFHLNQNYQSELHWTIIGAEPLMTQELWLSERKRGGEEGSSSSGGITLKELITIRQSSLLLYIQLSLSLHFEYNDLVLLHGCHGLYH